MCSRRFSSGFQATLRRLLLVLALSTLPSSFMMSQPLDKTKPSSPISAPLSTQPQILWPWLKTEIDSLPAIYKTLSDSWLTQVAQLTSNNQLLQVSNDSLTKENKSLSDSNKALSKKVATSESDLASSQAALTASIKSTAEAKAASNKVIADYRRKNITTAIVAFGIGVATGVLLAHFAHF